MFGVKGNQFLPCLQGEYARWASARLDRIMCADGAYWLFILGVNNSGTTILSKILETHPEIRTLPKEGQHLTTAFPKPNLLVYLHRSVDDLMSNIKKRGRAYETDISADYLLNIQNVYFEYFRTETNLPIIIVDVEGIDFINNRSFYEDIVEILKSSFPKGVHKLRVES